MSSNRARSRSSAGAEPLDLRSRPVQDSDALAYQQTFTDETGRSIFSVRAIDADGNEEANISQVVAIHIKNGQIVAQPAEPRIVEARAIKDGKIELEWLYVPRYEENGPGAAHEARIYWDAGTGAVDHSEPHATVTMGGPTSATRYTWDSAPLTDDQEYRFVVRAATAAWPAGIETQNTDEHAATADADQPAAPVLTASVT